MEPKNVFLSWTGADKDAKNTVKRYLEGRGITCLDSEERCVGDFMKWSLEAARMDGVFLLFLSKNISPSSVVLEEVAEALKTPNADKRILPICDDFDIYKTFKGGVLAQKNISAIFAKFKRKESDFEGIEYLEDKLEEIANKVKIAMATMSFNVYRENRYPKSISLYVGDDMRAVSFEKLYLNRIITEMENGEEIGKIASPKELMEKDGLYFLYGAGGSGKSLYIDQICREAGDVLVVKLSCADVAKKDEPIYDLMYKEVKDHMGGRGYFTDDNFKGMLLGHRLFLVLDGMDELPTNEAKVMFLKKAKDFCGDNYKHTGVLFTSRSERDVESVSFGSIRMFRMDKLTEEEIHLLGKNVFLEMGSERDQDTFYVRVSDLSDEIRCNPLLLTQLAVIYGNGEEIPSDIVGIFDKVNDLILRTPSSVTPPCEELREENIGGLLKRFAYEKYNHSQATDEKVLAYILRSKHPDNAKEMARICLKYLKERSIYVEGKFLHKMLLEYFTAVSYYEAIFDDFDCFLGGDKLKELFSHYSDLYWTDMIRLFLIKADNAAENDALKILYEEILRGDITEYTLLLDTATKLLKRKNIPTEAVCFDLLKKSISGEYPAYGPLFWYVPEYQLYESLVKAVEQLKGDCKALALARDVCVLNGIYTLREVTNSVDGYALFTSGKEGLVGTRLALCELFYTGKTERNGEEVYPRLFDLAETKALMTGGCGIYGRREKLFSDELGLYTPLELPLLGGEYIGLLTLPNDKEMAENELKKHSCTRVRAVSFIATERKTFGYIDFYRRNVKHLYLPENVIELENYWDNFLLLERKTFCEDNGIWYRALNRKTYIVPKGITELEYNVFDNDINITEIYLPEGLKEIGGFAFVKCSSLTDIHLPKEVQEIEEGAFSDCRSLTKIYLPEGIKEIDGFAFSGCISLAEIHLPEKLQSIESSAFEDCSSLAEIYLPDGLQNIGAHSFKGCSRLTEIRLPEEVREIEWSAFKDCSSLTAINLPDGLQKIEQEAFKGCSSLSRIYIPEGIEEIGGEAFAGCSSLKEIHLPEGLKKIGWDAFKGCSSLTEIYLPNGLEKIGMSIFEGCSCLSKISLPFYVKLVGVPSDVQIEVRGMSKEIDRSKITSYAFPEGIERIDEGYFKDCKNLLKVQLPESLNEIGLDSFNGCIGLTEINLPEGLQKIGNFAFAGCNISEIHLPKGLKEIGWGAFYGCIKLTKIYMPEELQSIGKRAFANCSSLTEIHLPEGIQEIGAETFADCNSLTEIRLPEGLKEIGAGSFLGCSSLTEIQLPEGLQKIGKSTFEGCSSLGKICLPEGLKEIGDASFENCSSLAEIRLPEGLQKIGDASFEGCSSLKEIDLPKGLQEIGTGNFIGCYSLTKIHLPEDLQKIESFSFWGCGSLAEIDLPQNIREIGAYAFLGCSSLTEVHLPNELKEIGIVAFSNCSSLAEIDLPECLQKIGWGAFKGCSLLTKIDLPEGLQEIGEKAFADCNLLKQILIPKSVMRIANGAFINCSSLEKVVIPRNYETEIERIFGGINRDIVEYIE